MKMEHPSSRIVARLMFRLLPIQILLALIGSVNAVVSSLFAGNIIGPEAMAVAGLYGPVSMLLGAFSALLVGGSQILCGKYMGRNLIHEMQNTFSLDLAVSAILGFLVTGFILLTSAFDLNGFMVRDAAIRPSYNLYAAGQAAGVMPTILSAQLSAFLSLENQTRRTTIASILCIAVNLLFSWLFVAVLRMGVLGLSLASSAAMWCFFLVEAQYYTSGKSTMRFTFRRLLWRDTVEIGRIGLPGAIGFGYQTLRGIIVNNLLTGYVGSVGVSAFATANTLLGFFWAIPTGMLAVSRMMFSVSIGEEDRQTLIDTMRTALYRYIPLMCAVIAMIIAAAVPFTRLYYRDATDPVYEMTISGFRILPLCMPMSILCMHFTCFGQVSGKQVLVHTLAALDGVICVAGFTGLLIPGMGMNSVYVANVLNGVVTTLYILGYAIFMKKRFPRSTEDLMVIPDDFGVAEADRISLSLHSMEEVIRISHTIQNFCLKKGIDERRAYLAGLSMEEMAGNVVAHGFAASAGKHTVDVRVIYKDGGLILRIRDDCRPFDPATRQKIADPGDPFRNIGIRMVYDIAGSVSYHSVLGLNVLTITF